MKLYLDLSYYQASSDAGEALLTKIKSLEQDRDSLKNLISEYTILCVRLVALKADVNDAKRDETPEIHSSKLSGLSEFESRLNSMRDLLRLLVLKSLFTMEPQPTLTYLMRLYSSKSEVGLDRVLEIPTREVVNYGLKELSKEWSLDITTTPFLFGSLLKLKCPVGETLRSYLGVNVSTILSQTGSC